MPELSQYQFEPLWEEGEFVLSRSVPNVALSPLLVMALAVAQPALESFQWLEHAYALRDTLEPAWAARPLALVRYQERPTLVLADPGGEILARLLGTPWEIAPFLRVAIGIAGALGRLHGRGLIHKDIKPAHILATPATGEAWLTGFGLASRLPRERLTPAPPEVIAGTLAYMAPEQTGRMNRSVDARSDLYAYGVTLYQMLTGALPFTATEPMEWVHCHIARPPRPPSEWVPGVPAALAAIVMKLLAKNAEDRYQTTAGVEVDLRRCLTAWESYGRIDPFPLGAHDTPDRLLIPEKLYGREREIAILLAAFERVVKGGAPELVLVSGYSGIGKSSVVNELHKVLVPPRGLFAAGKFDQYKRDIPYATLAQAFQSLLRPLLGKSDAELGRWRDALREALGPNGQLMVDLVPELTRILGEQPPVSELPPQDAQRRFQLVFRRFLGVFARPEHPLALFLDDLQWLDAATLDLLEDLLTQTDVRHVLLIGAYRDNEVTSAHPLMRKLEVIRNARALVQEMVLAPLARDDVGRLMAEALSCDQERAASLAQLVHEKTSGNPFFAMQFLSTLVEEGLLTFDHGAARWVWELTRIHAKGYTDNVVDLMVGKLSRLPVHTQQALQQLACLGNSAESDLLAMAFEDAQEKLHSDLEEALRSGLVLHADGAYTFLHDRVQEAAYALSPEDARAEAHLRIGRRLAAHTPPKKREEAIFEIVNHLNRGAALITARDEREQLAELNLSAGKRAKASTAYASALSYLVAGVALLADDGWERRPELMFALELHRAECEFLTGALAAAEARLTMLSSRAATTIDQATVACLCVDLYMTLDRSDRAVDVGLTYLRHLGVEWSPHPTEEEARREYERTWALLGSREIEELIDLPVMSDPVALATLDVLTKVVTPALYTDANLCSLAICRAVNLSLEHGNTDASCFGYVSLGAVVAGPRFGDYAAGFRFGRLAYDLVDQRGLQRFKARTYLVFGNLVMPWTKHVRTGRDLVRRAFDVANAIGDLPYATLSCNNLITNLLAAGDPLVDVQREAEEGLEFAEKGRFGLVIDRFAVQLGLLRTLRGLTPIFGCFNDERFDELRVERHLASNPMLALPECWYWIRKLQARFFAGDYVSAVEASVAAQRLLWTSPSYFETAEAHFYGALSHAASCDAALPAQYRQHVQALTAHHRQLVAWAEHGPENFANRATLVGAEIARLEGRELDAERLYEQAIRSARENGFVHNEALANELAARFYAARGFETIAHAYLRIARYGYLRWGADGKVRQLDQLYPHLRTEEAAAAPTGTIEVPVEHLDLATVIKVSQAVSGEIVLEKLLDTLMRTALAQAGAERGLLLLPRGDELRLAAEATTRGDTVSVRLTDQSMAAAALPASIVQYVIRTQDSVLLDDAAAPNAFAADASLGAHHARSILCVPLLNQAKLTGVLYLENTLTPHVFTPTRSAVLTLLASQAAISLENARLYAEHQRDAAALREQANLLSLTHDAMFVRTLDGVITFWNRGAEALYGWTTAQAVGQVAHDLLQTVSPSPLGQIAAAVLSAGRWEGELVHTKQDGTRVVVASRWVVQRDEWGAPVAILETDTDITERKRAEQRLLAQHTVTQILAEATTLPEATPQILQAVCECLDWDLGALWSFDRQAGVLRCVEVWHTASAEAPHFEATSHTRTFFPGSGLPGRVWSSRAPAYIPDIVQDSNFPRAPIAAREGLHTAFGFPILLGGDVLGVMEFFSHERRQPDQELLAMMATIGSQIGQFIERKRAEDALRASEASLAEGQQISHTGSYRWHVSTGEVHGSAEHSRIFGFDPAAGPRSHLRYRERVHPDDRPALVHVLDNAMRDQRAFQHEYRIVLPDGVVKHVQLAGHPDTDASGDLALVGTIMDITERKRAEEAVRTAQAELARVARLTTMGELTASIAHEVNQPLAAIVTNGNACMRFLAGDPPHLAYAREAVEAMIRDGHRASDVIRRIRALVQKSPPQPAWLDLNALILEVLALTRSDLQHQAIALQTHLAPALPPVPGDRIQVQQVLLNLLVNAVEALRGVPEGERALGVSAELDAAQAVRVTVRDTGIGLAAARLDRLFDAFYTTKPEGMGLGLAISRTIIEAHGGQLWATPNAGPGATFHFTLPLPSASPA